MCWTVVIPLKGLNILIFWAPLYFHLLLTSDETVQLLTLLISSGHLSSIYCCTVVSLLMYLKSLRIKASVKRLIRNAKVCTCVYMCVCWKWDGWEAANEERSVGSREGGWGRAGVSPHHAPGISYLKLSPGTHIRGRTALRGVSMRE